MAEIKNLGKGFIKLLFNKIIKRRFPLNVFIAVTNKCNLKCHYCYGEYYCRDNAREFTTDELINILIDIKKMGGVFVQFQGGEPLMRKDIDIIVKKAKELKLNTDLLTNGLLVQSKVEVVKMVDSVCLSLDGRKKINDKNRGKNTFEIIMRAIDICKSLKKPLRLNCVLTKETEPEDIDFLMSLCKEKKILANFCPSFKFKPLTEGKNYEYFDYEISKYNRFLDLIIDYKKKDYPIQFSIEAYKVSKNWEFPLSKKRAKKNEFSDFAKSGFPECYHGDYVCFIDSDGRMYPCCNFWNDYDNINVYHYGFEKAFNKLHRAGCVACYIYSYIDRNRLLNLNFKTLMNYLKLKKFEF